MSGIVGIVGCSTVDADLLRRMTVAMAFRGPDAQSVWANGSVGLGQATLGVGDVVGAVGPVGLEGRFITADARIDGRGDLVARLAARGRRDVDTADTGRLILHAYLEWGDRCVDHLLGDFAFAIWDDVERRLFCARDRFGVRPFYYADTAAGFIFSNTLECIRLHPAVDRSVNELAVGDFLLFGYNLDDTATTFTHINRLPPAHTLTRGTELKVRRYWRVPSDGAIRYSRSADYVEHFREVFEAAVADRLPSASVSISMSGGLDSTSVAAMARRLATRDGRDLRLRAHTIVYDSLFADEERTFAGLAASALGLEASVFAADDHEPFEGGGTATAPEPTDDPFVCMRALQLNDVASASRVLLCGEGGDELFWGTYVVDLLGRMPIRELARDVASSLVRGSRRPGLGIRQWLRARSGQGGVKPPFPRWINPAFANDHDLHSRWNHWHASETSKEHSLRPEAHGRLTTAPWAWYFEAFDAGVTRVPVELRYPFLDCRVVEYLLALPPIPWCVDKHLLRMAMRGLLPEVVRTRPKAALAGDPLRAHVQQSGGERIDRFTAAPELARFVDRDAIPPIGTMKSLDGTALCVRPYCLSQWLGRQAITREISRENSHGRRAVVHVP